MDNFNFVYFLREIPYLTAQSYISRIFDCSFSSDDIQSANVFISYYNEPTPHSYIDAQNKFPQNCFLQPSSVLGPRFILAAGQLDFFSVMNFISDLPCKRLAQEIRREFYSRPAELKIGDSVWIRDKPRIMGILNITPDSFYDGGKYFQLSDYTPIVQKMIEAGADIIDIGGESTRPNSSPTSEQEEIKRVLPVVKQIKERFHIPLSIDTTKPAVAKAVLDQGADMINDISGLSAGKEMVKLLLQYKASYCLTHILGTPKNMQNDPQYLDVVAETYQFFKNKLKFCLDLGLKKDRILLDPGIGFGKLLDHNLDLLKFISALQNLNSLILIGVSNKSFIGNLLQRQIDERLIGSLTAQVFGWERGVAVFRAHNIRKSKDSLAMACHYTNA